MRPTANEFANTAARRLRQTPSDAECALWQVLRAGRAGEPRFRRQLPIDRYIADFACLRERLVVEVDGSQHADQMAYDAARTQRLEALGFRVVRFWAGDVLRSPSEIVDAIWAVVHASRNERVKKNMSTDRVR
jgi:very-short-patch-repair endonuclease